MWVRKLLIVALVTGLWIPAASAMSPGRLMELLHEHWSHVRDFKARFCQTQVVEQFARPVVVHGLIRSVSPTYLRIDFQQEGQEISEFVESVTQTIEYNGEYWFRYRPHSRTVTIGEQPDSQALLPLLMITGAVSVDPNEFRERYTIKPTERVEYEGTPAIRVEVMTQEPNPELRAYCNIFLRESDMVPLYMQYKGSELDTEVRIFDTERNVGLVERDLHLRVPRGTRQIMR